VTDRLKIPWAAGAPLTSPSRRLFLSPVGLALLGGTLLAVSLKLVDWTAELLWFRTFGYESVFWRLRLAEVAMFAAAFVPSRLARSIQRLPQASARQMLTFSNSNTQTTSKTPATRVSIALLFACSNAVSHLDVWKNQTYIWKPSLSLFRHDSFVSVYAVIISDTKCADWRV
jgi:hypothetical protein